MHKLQEEVLSSLGWSIRSGDGSNLALTHKIPKRFNETICLNVHDTQNINRMATNIKVAAARCMETEDRIVKHILEELVSNSTTAMVIRRAVYNRAKKEEINWEKAQLQKSPSDLLDESRIIRDRRDIVGALEPCYEVFQDPLIHRLYLTPPGESIVGKLYDTLQDTDDFFLEKMELLEKNFVGLS